jgi:hypothetical protein
MTQRSRQLETENLPENIIIIKIIIIGRSVEELGQLE